MHPIFLYWVLVVKPLYLIYPWYVSNGWHKSASLLHIPVQKPLIPTVRPRRVTFTGSLWALSMNSPKYIFVLFAVNDCISIFITHLTKKIVAHNRTKRPFQAFGANKPKQTTAYSYSLCHTSYNYLSLKPSPLRERVGWGGDKTAITHYSLNPENEKYNNAIAAIWASSTLIGRPCSFAKAMIFA